MPANTGERWKDAVDLIVSVRKGSMDDNQFRATIEHNIRQVELTARKEERERCAKEARESVLASNSYDTDRAYNSACEDIAQAIEKLSE